MTEPTNENVTMLGAQSVRKVPDLTPPSNRPARAQRKEATGPVTVEGGQTSASPDAPAGVEDIGKALKAARAPKAPKAPAAPKAPRTSRFAALYKPHFVITLQVPSNPKRGGTPSYDRFELYHNGMTVGEWLKKGGLWPDMSWDVGHGFIKVAAPDGAAAEAPTEAPVEAAAAPVADTVAAVEEAEAKE